MRLARTARTLLVLALVVPAGWMPWLAASALAQGGCEFRLGFKVLHDELLQVGDCIDNESYNAIGDSNQHTTGGLLAWRKADNWTAFTDGYRTWVNGPFGIQVRLNTQRFPWEHDTSASSATSSTTSVSASKQCTAVATSGSVSAVGLNGSTTIINSSGGSTDSVNNHSSSSSSPGVATTGC